LLWHPESELLFLPLPHCQLHKFMSSSLPKHHIVGH
jgi:hypothetical protein